jgi:transcriptional regulator GlxA family with amidase domain
MGENPRARSRRPRGYAAQVYDELVASYGKAQLLASAPVHSSMECAARIVEEIIDHTHGDVRLRLAVLATRLHVSLRSLERHFKEKLGASPGLLQQQTRLNWAQAAIRDDPARKLESIAREIGYTSEAAFTHFFEKRTGLSPDEYRQQCRSGEKS